MTEEELAEMRESHAARPYIRTGGEPGIQCLQCLQDWPCDASTLLGEVDRLRAENAQLLIRDIRRMVGPGGGA